jgi:hypothetical protein
MSQRIPSKTPACLLFEPLLPLVALGEHDATDTLAHLATCTHCQSELAGYAALRVSLRRELGPQPAAAWPAPWASRPLTMEDVMDPHAGERPSLSRMPLPPSRPSRSAGLSRGAVAAALLIAVSVLAVLHFVPPAPSQVSALKTPTVGQYPTVPSLPLLNVQPSLHLDADQRLGGTAAGLTRLFGAPTGTPTPGAVWRTTLDGKPIDVSAQSADYRYANDGQPHLSIISFGQPTDSHGQLLGAPESFDPASLVALITSFLPSDARYTGEVVSNGGFTISGAAEHVYMSASLAALFSTHPSRVFMNFGGPPPAAGTIAWACAGNYGSTLVSHCAIWTGV